MTIIRSPLKAIRDLAFTGRCGHSVYCLWLECDSCGDANDLHRLDRAFGTFIKESDRPTLIIVDSHIGYGAPNKQDTHSAHGEPWVKKKLVSQTLLWLAGRPLRFLVPDEVPAHFNRVSEKGKELRSAWMARFADYQAKYPELASHLYQMQHRQLPAGWKTVKFLLFPPDAKGLAGREVSESC